MDSLDPTVLIDTWHASIYKESFCDPCWLDGKYWDRYCHWDPENGGFKLIYCRDKAKDKKPSFVITVKQKDTNIILTIQKYPSNINESNQLKLKIIYNFHSKKL